MADSPTLKPPLHADDHAQGAPVGEGVIELVEYADFQCPHCVRATQAVQQLLAERPDRLRFAFRHFPLSRLHPLARKAAEATEAAAVQGAFWPLHDLLFVRAPAIDQPHLLTYAAELGLDVARFESELTTGVHGPRVQRDVGTGARSGVNATPTFFINGKRYDGSHHVDNLRAALDAATATP